MVRFQEEAWQELLLQRYNFYSKIPMFRLRISIVNVDFNFFIVFICINRSKYYPFIILFTRCMVLTPLPLNFATFLMEYPLWSKLTTSLYSAFICSSVFTELILRQSFPPFSIYRFRPDCNRNEILSRSNCAQVESVATIIGAKRDGCPSSSYNVSCSFCM